MQKLKIVYIFQKVQTVSVQIKGKIEQFSQSVIKQKNLCQFYTFLFNRSTLPIKNETMKSLSKLVFYSQRNSFLFP
jgi:hypothetical protein